MLLKSRTIHPPLRTLPHIGAAAVFDSSPPARYLIPLQQITELRVIARALGRPRVENLAGTAAVIREIEAGLRTDQVWNH